MKEFKINTYKSLDDLKKHYEKDKSILSESMSISEMYDNGIMISYRLYCNKKTIEFNQYYK